MRLIGLVLLLVLAAAAGPAELRRDVEALAFERNLSKPNELERAALYLEGELKRAGYRPTRQTYHVGGQSCSNLIAERKGAAPVVLVGAHYDSVKGCPGADDNATGCAAVLALARRFPSPWDPRRATLRFVFFVNEEPPFFQQEGKMGSMVYAAACPDPIKAMLSLETLGFYSDRPNSQKIPEGVARQPGDDVGNFVALVGHPESKRLAETVVAAWSSPVRLQVVVASDEHDGVGWSDHWSFWRKGNPALMVTDTALYRNPAYHTREDTPEKLDYRRFSQVVDGLATVVSHLTKL